MGGAHSTAVFSREDMQIYEACTSLTSAEILMHTRLQRVHPFHRGAQELNPIAMTEVCEKLLEQRGIFLRHSEIRTT